MSESLITLQILQSLCGDRLVVPRVASRELWAPDPVHLVVGSLWVGDERRVSSLFTCTAQPLSSRHSIEQKSAFLQLPQVLREPPRTPAVSVTVSLAQPLRTLLFCNRAGLTCSMTVQAASREVCCRIHRSERDGEQGGPRASEQVEAKDQEVRRSAREGVLFERDTLTEQRNVVLYLQLNPFGTTITAYSPAEPLFPLEPSPWTRRFAPLAPSTSSSLSSRRLATARTAYKNHRLTLRSSTTPLQLQQQAQLLSYLETRLFRLSSKMSHSCQSCLLDIGGDTGRQAMVCSRCKSAAW